ncbi:MAG TPA: YihY/virulence factor BrkB family protein [Terriglobales bacterium]
MIIRATSRPSVAAKSFWKLGGLTPWELSRSVFEEITANNVFGRAAELAFYFLFALFPLMFLMMTLFGLFASHSGELQTDLLSYFADFLPPTAFQLLRGIATEIAPHASRGKLIFGVVSALWVISSCISSTISFLNAAYHVRETRSWFRARAIALVLSLLISILLLAALFMVLVGSHFVDWLGAGLRLHPLVVLVGKALQWPTVIFFVALSCSLIYRYGPDLKERRSWHWFTPGAAFGAFVWLAASFGFRMYLHFFNNYSVAYGSLGALMILLVWLYATGLACLIGAEINAEIERSSRKDEGTSEVTN